MAHAHITIAPNQSMAGATGKYVLRVPTESKVATVAAELEISEGVIGEAVAVLRHHFADGTVSAWTKGPNGIRSTSMTKLAPRPAQ